MSTPTIAPTSLPSKNQFAMLANKYDNDDYTVVISNKAQKTANVDNDSPAIEYAISDSGASRHFLVEGAPVTNLQVADNPISITIPTNMCYSCGWDVPYWHTIKNCPTGFRNAHHQEGCDRGNAQAYINTGNNVRLKGREKTVYPINLYEGRC